MSEHASSLRQLSQTPPLRSTDARFDALPLHDPLFSEWMFEQNLDWATVRRYHTERQVIESKVEALIEWLNFRPGYSVLDIGSGPGLFAASFGFHGAMVTGIDIAPAAARSARRFNAGVPCSFLQGDVKSAGLNTSSFDAAIWLHGQAALCSPLELDEKLAAIRNALRADGSLAIEVIDRERVSIPPASTSWVAGRNAWGPGESIVLSERAWDEKTSAIVSRYQVIDSITGRLSVYGESERLLNAVDWCHALDRAGFPSLEIHRRWDDRIAGGNDWVVIVGK